MSAEMLREAARLMRARATSANQLRDAYPELTGGRLAHRTPMAIAEAFKAFFWGDSTIPGYDESIEADAEHQAPWHPAVALAVADWLDIFSDAEWPYCDCGDGDCNYGPCIAQRRALAVAHAYLGESS